MNIVLNWISLLPVWRCHEWSEMEIFGRNYWIEISYDDDSLLKKFQRFLQFSNWRIYSWILIKSSNIIPWIKFQCKDLRNPRNRWRGICIFQRRDRQPRCLESRYSNDSRKTDHDFNSLKTEREDNFVSPVSLFACLWASSRGLAAAILRRHTETKRPPDAVLNNATQLPDGKVLTSLFASTFLSDDCSIVPLVRARLETTTR